MGFKPRRCVEEIKPKALFAYFIEKALQLRINYNWPGD